MMAAESRQSVWQLSALLQGVVPVPPTRDVPVYGLAVDSRCVRPGDLFLACAGIRQHGLAFMADAVRAGAVAIAWEPATGVPEIPVATAAGSIPVFPVSSLGAKIGTIASRFFHDPSQQLNVVGVSGTDGKTSCSHFIAQLLGSRQSPCGLLGTLGYGVYGRLEPGARTTPDALTLQTYLAGFRDQGLSHVVLEVSSHALDQGRVSGIEFDTALFTNLGRDHLDYHGDVASYGRAKRRLFEQPGLDAAVLNIDDPFSHELVAVLADRTRIIAYGLAELPAWIKSRANVNWVLGKALQVSASGIHMEVDTSWGVGKLQSALLGEFNGRNLLGVLGVALASGMTLPVALQRLQQVRSVPGRMESFGGDCGKPLVIVDYAHTPQALEHALRALRQICGGSLWCVFGAGGDRDRGKRPLMGARAEQFADHVVLTDDNPRNEDPRQIIAEILTGMSKPDAVCVEHNRLSAIRWAVENAAAADVVLIAGKGHESYQEIGDQRIPFDDRRKVAALLGGGRL